MHTIYLAGKWAAQARLRGIARQLTGRGWTVVASWLHEPDQRLTPAQEAEIADTDVREVERADVLVLDTFDDDERGGREVEWGVALAHDKPVYIVGPMRNVFHRLAWGHWDTWRDALDALASARRTEAP